MISLELTNVSAKEAVFECQLCSPKLCPAECTDSRTAAGISRRRCYVSTIALLKEHSKTGAKEGEANKQVPLLCDCTFRVAWKFCFISCHAFPPPRKNCSPHEQLYLLEQITQMHVAQLLQSLLSLTFALFLPCPHHLLWRQHCPWSHDSCARLGSKFRGQQISTEDTNHKEKAFSYLKNNVHASVAT